MIQPFIDALNGTWQFLLLMTSTAPIGVWSFLIAAVFPAVFLPWLKRAAPTSWTKESRDFLLQTFALVAGIGLAWLPWQTLNGFLVGIMAGFMSPYLQKGFSAVTGVVYRWWYKRLVGSDPGQCKGPPA